MLINRLAAFGRLENGALDLRPGLNLIEIPDEGRRALWASLLPALLYGPDAQSPPAGISQATLEASTFRGGVTLARWTAGPEAPIAETARRRGMTPKRVRGLLKELYRAYFQLYPNEAKY